MPKRISSDQLDAVVTAVAEFATGLAVSELQSRFPDLPRRSLQRRLGRLVEAGRLQAQGRGPKRRYVLAPERGSIASDIRPDEALTRLSPEIPLSAAGRKLNSELDRPLSQRKPVGYRREFLDVYQPNETF